MAATTGRNHFYRRAGPGGHLPALTNTEFEQTPTFKFSMTANHLIIVNDSSKTNLLFSFDGVEVDGEVFPRDKSLTLNWKLASRIWLKADAATPETPIRIWAWVE
jgi:hypothetical protein